MISTAMPVKALLVGSLFLAPGGINSGFGQGSEPKDQGRSADDIPSCPKCVLTFERLVRLEDKLEGVFTSETPRSVSQDSRGRYYLTFWSSTAVGVYDSAGAPIGTIGRKGDGPGEFRAAFMADVGPGDTLRVFDPIRRTISVFSPNGKFVRKHVMSIAVDAIVPGSAGPIIASSVPADGALGRTADSGRLFHLLSPDARAVRRSFNSAAPPADWYNMVPRYYLASATPGGRFWAVRVAGYEVSLWDTAGERLRHFPRSPSWARRLPGHDKMDAPLPLVNGIAEAKDGRIAVVGVYPVVDWYRYHNREVLAESEEKGLNLVETNKLYRSILEILDSRTGQLVVSASIPGYAVQLLANDRVATFEFDEEGNRWVTIWRWRLLPDK